MAPLMISDPDRSIHGTADELEAMAAGDRAAWERLCSRCTSDVRRAAERIAGPSGLADDAAQEAFLRLWRSAASFRGHPADRDAHAQAWIRRVAISAALDVVRTAAARRRREGALEDVAAPEPADAPPLTLVLERMAELPEREREPLALHVLAGRPYEDVARELGCSAGAARVRVHRSLKRLRQRLGRATTLAALLGTLRGATLAAPEAFDALAAALASSTTRIGAALICAVLAAVIACVLGTLGGRRSAEAQESSAPGPIPAASLASASSPVTTPGAATPASAPVDRPRVRVDLAEGAPWLVEVGTGGYGPLGSAITVPFIASGTGSIVPTVLTWSIPRSSHGGIHGGAQDLPQEVVAALPEALRVGLAKDAHGQPTGYACFMLIEDGKRGLATAHVLPLSPMRAMAAQAGGASSARVTARGLTPGFDRFQQVVLLDHLLEVPVSPAAGG